MSRIELLHSNQYGLMKSCGPLHVICLQGKGVSMLKGNSPRSKTRDKYQLNHRIEFDSVEFDKCSSTGQHSILRNMIWIV